MKNGLFLFSFILFIGCGDSEMVPPLDDAPFSLKVERILGDYIGVYNRVRRDNYAMVIEDTTINDVLYIIEDYPSSEDSIVLFTGTARTRIFIDSTFSGRNSSFSYSIEGSTLSIFTSSGGNGPSGSTSYVGVKQ